MLTSLALIFLIGISLGWIFKKLHCPSLLGMLLTGIVLGPYALDLLDESILGISQDLRQLALIIILTRAGLSLDLKDLKKVGRPAFLMCFVPACFEIVGAMLLAPPLLGVSLLEAALIGSVIAAVSPAIIVPKMLKLMKEGYGTKNSIPQLILAGASVDDVFVIVMFTSFVALSQDGSFSPSTLIQIPISIVTGIIFGFVVGMAFSTYFKHIRIRDSIKVVVLLSVSFLMVALEHALTDILPLSGLLAVMSCGIAIGRQSPEVSDRLSIKYSKLWVVAEVLLFVLVGATVDIKFAVASGLSAVLLILGALGLRMLGVYICLLKTKLPIKERLFCMIAYTPKATVQAAIGSIPLTMGLSGGQIVLTVAVLAILITAPLGAFCIDMSYRCLLTK